MILTMFWMLHSVEIVTDHYFAELKAPLVKHQVMSNVAIPCLGVHLSMLKTYEFALGFRETLWYSSFPADLGLYRPIPTGVIEKTSTCWC